MCNNIIVQAGNPRQNPVFNRGHGNIIIVINRGPQVPGRHVHQDRQWRCAAAVATLYFTSSQDPRLRTLRNLAYFKKRIVRITLQLLNVISDSVLLSTLYGKKLLSNEREGPVFRGNVYGRLVFRT